MAIKGRRPWGPSHPIAMVCMIWRAMCGNGRRTGTRSIIQHTRPGLAASRSIREGGQESRVLILHNRRSASQERCSKGGPSSARLITACVIARRHVFPRRLIPLRATSASGVLSMSLLIIDPSLMVYPLSTKTLFGNLIGIAGKPARGTLSSQILAGQYQAETHDRTGGFRPAAAVWDAQARLTTTLLSRVRSALRLS